MSELFSLHEQLSPRLAWLKKHKIHTYYCETSEEGKHWAWTGDSPPENLINGAPLSAFFAQADTQVDALVAHAKRRGIRMWNEEGI